MVKIIGAGLEWLLHVAETSGLEAPQSGPVPGILGGAFKLSLCGVEEAGFARCLHSFSLPQKCLSFVEDAFLGGSPSTSNEVNNALRTGGRNMQKPQIQRRNAYAHHI